MKADLSERLEQGRTMAINSRNRGFHAGKSAQGWTVQRPNEPDQLEETIAYYRAMIAKHVRATPIGQFNPDTEIPF